MAATGKITVAYGVQNLPCVLLLSATSATEDSIGGSGGIGGIGIKTLDGASFIDNYFALPQPR